MKLFAKYNRVNITATILTFLAGSIAFYFVLQYVLIRQLDETLHAEQQEITDYIQTHNALPEIQNTKHQWIIVEKTNNRIIKAKPHSFPVYNRKEKEQESIRQLSFTAYAGNQLYKVTVNKSEAETEDLLKLIILVTVGMIGLILLINYIVNRKLVARLWQPFYLTIEKIKNYHITAQQPLDLSNTGIDEISLLNESLNKMTTRIYDDYISLRTFTENASHEMQTPLAVIRSKVEALLQDAEGKEKTVEQLLVIENTIQKLSRLNQSLLLLTKLENRQFASEETVDLDEIVRLKLMEREEMIKAKKLVVTQNCLKTIVPFHSHLAEILISNLLNNAIQYTPENGEILISLDEKNLSVANTGLGYPLNADKVFQRFYKADQQSKGTGLGLAIIKEICTVSGYAISYQFNDNKHEFSIQFSEKHD